LDATCLAKELISLVDPKARVSKCSRNTLASSEVPQKVGMVSKTARRMDKASSTMDETSPEKHVSAGILPILSESTLLGREGISEDTDPELDDIPR
jgi:hypothetical protein